MENISAIVARATKAGLVADEWYTASIINYEAGYVARNARYYGLNTDPQIKAGFKAYLQTELADLLMQTRILAHVMELDWGFTVELGEHRLDDTIAKFAVDNIRPVNTLAEAFHYKHEGD